MPSSIPNVPVVSTAEAEAFESNLFGGDERRIWTAMLKAGGSVAAAALEDLEEIGGFPARGRILVLAGKGNNAGDALIAARDVLGIFPVSSCDVLFAFGSRGLKPLAARAWRSLCEGGRGRVRPTGPADLLGPYDLCLDGIFGFQYRAPLPPEASAAIAASSIPRIRFRAAVDLPTGWKEKGAFRADFTYATGTVKDPILGCANAGRPRYLDLGFYKGNDKAAAKGDRVVLRSILEPLAGLRPAGSDKRSQGHLVIVGGSENFPGAILMATLSALRSGVGLVTACVPENLVPAYAARAPEAMWVGLPEAGSGGLSPAGFARVMKVLERGSALAIGPGLGREPKSQALALRIVSASPLPLVIDADALQPGIVRAGKAPRVLTPHAGEFARIAKGAALRKLCAELNAVIVEKGPVTRISDGGAVYHSFFGGPVLSRGGSGDILAGLAGGLLAQTPGEPLLAACRAAVWHGSAADLLARGHGQAAVHTLQLLDFLAPALRESPACPAS